MRPLFPSLSQSGTELLTHPVRETAMARAVDISQSEEKKGRERENGAGESFSCSLFFFLSLPFFLVTDDFFFPSCRQS